MKEAIAYVNGTYLPHAEAKVSIFDRGFLMADAVYEVCAVIDGKLIDNAAHLKRLARSLGELNMGLPVSFAQLLDIQKQLLLKNRLDNGVLYLQVTRGAGPRDFVIDETMTPTLVLFVTHKDILAAQEEKPLRIMTQPDIRWRRRDIKTTQLLAQSLAKTIAVSTGYDDAWLVDGNGYVSEGSASNAWIVKDDRVYTRRASHDILNGITRQTLIEVMRQLEVTLVERKFTPHEATLADEAFLTSAGMLTRAVASIDGKTIGDGQAGRMTAALRKAYIDLVTRKSGDE